MAINTLSSVELTQTPETSAAFVPVDIKAVSQSSPLTSAKGRVVVVAGSLDNNGTYTAGPINVNSALPAGAATAANQVGTGTAAQTVQGNVAAATADSGNPIKTGGHARSTQLTAVANDQRQDAWFQLNGSQSVTVCGSNGSVGALGIPNAGLSGQTGLYTASQNAVMNPSGTWDAQRKGSALSRIASTATGGSPTVAKASAGDAQQFWGLNGAVATYLQLYNSATTPVVGTTTIVATYPIAATAQFNQTIPNSLYFSAGVAFAFTTDAAGTTAAAAAAVTSFALFGA